MSLTREDLEVIGTAVSDRLKALPQNGQPRVEALFAPPVNNVEVSPTPVEVFNQVESPAVHVTVDLTQLAEALTDLLSPMLEAMRRQGETMIELLKALNRRPAPIIQPSEVRVESPVKVFVPKQDKAKRTFKIVHDDGTETKVSEE